MGHQVSIEASEPPASRRSEAVHFCNRPISVGDGNAGLATGADQPELLCPHFCLLTYLHSCETGQRTSSLQPGQDRAPQTSKEGLFAVTEPAPTWRGPPLVRSSAQNWVQGRPAGGVGPHRSALGPYGGNCELRNRLHHRGPVPTITPLTSLDLKSAFLDQRL
jgi:hypothetical protein